MKGCTRTVKAVLVAIPDGRTDERTARPGLLSPSIPDQSPPPPFAAVPSTIPLTSIPRGTRFDCEALFVPTDLLYQLVTISCQILPLARISFFPPASRVPLHGVSGLPRNLPLRHYLPNYLLSFRLSYDGQCSFAVCDLNLSSFDSASEACT